MEPAWFFQKRGKDFDVYYIPILLVQLLAAAIITLFMTTNFFIAAETSAPTCLPSLIVLFYSIVGPCFMQIAMNWLEIAGNHFLKTFCQRKRGNCHQLLYRKSRLFSTRLSFV